jgi:hypothetical protein
MEQHGEKKEWVTPELLVLVRSHPEEAILTACKLGLGSSGPFSFNVACTLVDGCGGFCIDLTGT